MSAWVLLCGRDAAVLAAFSEFGEHVGLAFQIVDDLLDVEESSEALGKTAGKDEAQQKITFPAVYGLERSREMAEEERQAATLRYASLTIAPNGFARSPISSSNGARERPSRRRTCYSTAS